MTPSKLVNTELAATYWHMLNKPDTPISLIRQRDLKAAKRALYDLCKRGQLTNHGAKARGQARWDLDELHRVAKARNIS